MSPRAARLARPLLVQAGQGRPALQGAYGEAGQVVVATGVHAGHFGGFAADQGRTCLDASFDDAFDH